MAHSAALVALVVAVAGVAAGQSCDPLEGAPFNPACAKGSPLPLGESKPYCVRVNQYEVGVNVTAEYECVACTNDCDCEAANQYCSSAPGKVGTCVAFEKIGATGCRQLTPAQLVDPDFEDEWKCGDTFEVENPLNASDPFIISDYEGVCFQGVCRMCNPDSQVCTDSTGKFTGRYCAYPGDKVDSQQTQWSPVVYGNQPEYVWWALFFPLFILLICCQVVQLIKM